MRRTEQSLGIASELSYARSTPALRGLAISGRSGRLTWRGRDRFTTRVVYEHHTGEHRESLTRQLLFRRSCFGTICSSLWKTAPLSDQKDAVRAKRNLTAHPVSPSAIQLWMDKMLRTFRVHRTLEELVHDDHQAQYKESADEPRRYMGSPPREAAAPR